jgi:hypothetical protein
VELPQAPGKRDHWYIFGLVWTTPMILTICAFVSCSCEIEARFVMRHFFGSSETAIALVAVYLFSISHFLTSAAIRVAFELCALFW